MRTARVMTTAVAIAIAAVAWPTSAQEQPPTWSISCHVDTSSMGVSRNEFDSAMRRRLRSLGDVDVAGPESKCHVSLLKLTITGGGPDVHFVSTLITYKMNFRSWLIQSMVMQHYGISDQQAEMISQSLDNTGYEIVKYFGIFSGTSPHELSRRIVSAIDTQVFEQSRQLDRVLKERIQQAVENRKTQNAR
jgi:hypothetical protein